MKKRILISAVIVWASLFGIFSLNAAGNRVEIVSPNYASKQLSQDGMHITNVINKDNTDLVNGNVAIEIIINNSKETEIMYAIDNGNTMSANKAALIDSLKTNAKTLESTNNIKQGIVTTTDGNITTIPVDNANIESQLDSVKNMTSGTTNGDILDSISKAAESFSSSASEKFIIVALASLPTDLTSLTNKINECSKNGIRVIAYGINLNTTNFRTAFDAATRYEISPSNFNQINYVGSVTTHMPKPKQAIETKISFDNYILNNFDIIDVKTNNGIASFDTATNTITWQAGTIESNQIVKLTYYLSLKQVVDQSVIEKLTLRTNRQIVVTQQGTTIGTYPEDSKIEDQICSPTIKILREAIDNPKQPVDNPETGVAEYLVFGICLVAVGSTTLLILNRKNQFSKI